MDTKELLQAVCTISGNHRSGVALQGCGALLTPYHVLTSFLTFGPMIMGTIRFENAHGEQSAMCKESLIAGNPEYDLAILRMAQPIGKQFLRLAPTLNPSVAFKEAAPLMILTRFNGQEDIIEIEPTGDEIEIFSGFDRDYSMELELFYTRSGLQPANYGSPIVDQQGYIVSVLSGSAEYDPAHNVTGALQEAMRAIVQQTLQLC